MNKALTVKKALEQGYKYCSPEDGEVELIRIEVCDFSKKGGYTLASKKATSFQLHDNFLYELLDDYLSGQDEVGDENGRLNELAAEANYQPLTEQINKLFKKIKYYHPTKIKLIP